MLKRIVIPAVFMLLLAACGAQETPTPTAAPTETPVPTQAAPTSTPAPTVDVASLTTADLQATVEALEEELAIEERHLEAASGYEGASVQEAISSLKRQIREIRALIAAADGGAEATAEATTESGG